MGCIGSKSKDTELVSICKKRKELIRSAVKYRFDLSDYHFAYIRALRESGNALDQFVSDQLMFSTSQSPYRILTLPRKGKGKDSPSPTSLARALSSSGNSSPKNSSHFHYSILSSKSRFISDSDHISISSSSGTGHIHLSSDSSDPPLKIQQTENVFYMKSSPPIPAVTFTDSDTATKTVQWGDNFYYNDYSPYSNSIHDRENVPSVPPAPPPDDFQSWDYFNPFNSYKIMYPKYSYDWSAISVDSGDVRATEGIPDLEDEADRVFLRENNTEKKPMDDSHDNFSESPSKPVSVMKKNNVTIEKKLKNVSTVSMSKSSVSEHSLNKKETSFEMDSHSVENDTSSVLKSLSPSPGKQDIQSAVREIRKQFEIASDSGKEVLGLLEFGKLDYHTKGSISQAIFSRIQDYLTTSAFTFLGLISRYVKHKDNNGRNDRKYLCMKSSNLSSTLQTLYEWEKKLLKEVQNEEKLRVLYAKKIKILKRMNLIGEDPSKIDVIQSLVRKLSVKISISLKVINSISKRIHKTRDQDLHPQIAELVQGFKRMWESLLDSHQKQFRVINRSQNHRITIDTVNKKDPSLRATIKLEEELLNWSNCFKSWILAQKRYIESLNGWLVKSLSQEPEVTPDGIVPFSPQKIGAPAIFVICNDWYRAMDIISKNDVLTTISNFTSNVHEIQRRQRESLKQKQNLKHSRKTRKSHHWKIKIPLIENINMNGETGKLDASDKGLDQERLNLTEIDSSTLQKDLAEFFASLESFSLEMVKGYKQIRI